MTKEEFKRLSPGDAVRHVSDVRGYIVTANYGSRVTAVSTADMTNPQAWDIIKPNWDGVAQVHVSTDD